MAGAMIEARKKFGSATQGFDHRVGHLRPLRMTAEHDLRSSEKCIEVHSGKIGNISIYGQS